MLSEAAWLRLGDEVIRTEGASGALRVFQEAVRSEPDNFALQMSLGLAYEGVVTQVRTCRGEVIPLCPTSTAKRDASRHAFTAFDRAESVRPADPAAPQSRANHYHLWGLVEEALGEYEAANKRRRLPEEVGERAVGIVMIQMGIGDPEFRQVEGRGFTIAFPEPGLAEARWADRRRMTERRP